MKVEIIPPPDFSFYETVHSHGWRHLAPYSWDESTGTLRRVHRFASGAVDLLDITDEGSHVAVRADRTSEHGDLRRAIARMLQIDRDLAEFHRFCLDYPELRHIPAHYKGRLLRSPTLFEDICKVILTTNTTWAQTKAMCSRLVTEFGDSLSGVDLHTFPTPERIAAVSRAEFAERARLGYRAPAVHGLAIDIASGALDLDALETSRLDSAEVRRRLLALRGVGPYAAACLMLYLGRPGYVNVDSWARTLLSRELGRAVTDRDVHDHFARYAPWQGLVYNFYAWNHDEERGASSDVAS